MVVVVLAQLLRTPPKGYVPPGQPAGARRGREERRFFAGGDARHPAILFAVVHVRLRGRRGLMIIASWPTIAKKQAGLAMGFMLVASLAIGNGAGRILAGMASDKLGRKPTIFGCLCSRRS